MKKSLFAKKSAVLVCTLALALSLAFGLMACVSSPTGTLDNGKNGDTDTGISVTSVVITGPGGELIVGSGKLYTAVVLPENATNKTVTWAVVTNGANGSINEHGVFSANAVGIYEITATAGGKTSEKYQIKVKADPDMMILGTYTAVPHARTPASNPILEGKAEQMLGGGTPANFIPANSLIVSANNSVTLTVGSGGNAFLLPDANNCNWRFLCEGGTLTLQYQLKGATTWTGYNGSQKASYTYNGTYQIKQTIMGAWNAETKVISLTLGVTLDGDVPETTTRIFDFTV